MLEYIQFYLLKHIGDKPNIIMIIDDYDLFYINDRYLKLLSPESLKATGFTKDIISNSYQCPILLNDDMSIDEENNKHIGEYLFDVLLSSKETLQKEAGIVYKRERLRHITKNKTMFEKLNFTYMGEL